MDVDVERLFVQSNDGWNNVDSSKSFKPRVAQLTLDSLSIRSDEYSDS